MEALELCNSIRKEFEGISESKIPLDALPEKMQDMVLALHREENYSIEYTIASLLMAVSTAIGNTVSIRIKGGWTSCPMLYLILVGRPGMGKTPPLDFAFRPIQKRDTEQTRKFMKDKELYDAAVEGKRGNKDESIDLPPKPVLRRTLISDFTPEAMMHALNDNQRGIVLYVDEIMGMFNSVKAAIALSEYFEGCYTAIQRFILMDGLEPQKKEFLDNVPQHFTTADAVMAGKEAGLSERSVMYALVNLTNDHIIKKLKRGEYEKLQQ